MYSRGPPARREPPLARAGAAARSIWPRPTPVTRSERDGLVCADPRPADPGASPAPARSGEKGERLRCGAAAAAGDIARLP